MVEFSKRMLSNGMRLLHHYDAQTRMVAVNIMVGVGSRDENPGTTGLAHLMEHLMFSGSQNAVNFDLELQKAGGESNAWTSVDFTNFYDVLPAQNIETAFWLESDRMNYLLLDEQSIEVQRSVVTQEFLQRYANVPYGDLNHIIHQQAYKLHPYRWPSIGLSTEDIANISRSDIEKFYHNYYRMSNIIICVSGNVSLSDATLLAEKWFGEFDTSSVVAKSYPAEPSQGELRQTTVHRDVPQDVINIAFHMCGRSHNDFVVCDMISDMLANGKSSRFYQNVISRSDVFTELDAAVEGTADPGLFLIRGKLSHKASMQQAEDLIYDELNRLITEHPHADELQKCVNKFHSTSLFENLSYLQKATRLCQCEMNGDAGRINTEIEAYRQVSPDDIMRVSKQLFDNSNASVVYYCGMK